MKTLTAGMVSHVGRSFGRPCMRCTCAVGEKMLLLIMVAYLVLGCLMDAMAMIILTVPIIFPVVTQLGFDPIANSPAEYAERIKTEGARWEAVARAASAPSRMHMRFSNIATVGLEKRE